MTNITACPLDCYDACGVVYEDKKLKGLKTGHTKGFLCPHLNHYTKHKTISLPRYKGREISMQEALSYLADMIRTSPKDRVLFYRGSGNFALMQEVSDHFFASYGATLTEGSLCDGAGESGILQGRGSNVNMPISEIEKSEVVIFWGRNPHTTSSHLLPLIKNKKIIVIDPIETKIAKNADCFVQIKPHGDLLFAMLLSRFLHIEQGANKDHLKQYASKYEEFYELTQSIRIKAALKSIDASLDDIMKILDIVREKKVAIVCGVGVQKYSDGSDVLRAIDAFAVMLGLFGKEGCGVAYLGFSKDNINMPFNTKAKRVSKVNTDFSKFDTVFIQGANPLSQMPDSMRVNESIDRVKNIVYFGLHENETSKKADLVIPAKSFLYKNDIRTSYSHNAMMPMPKVDENSAGISEYDLSAFLCREFDIEIESEEFYLEYFKNQAFEKTDGSLEVKGRDTIAYKNGFDTQDKNFNFLKEFSDDFDMENDFFLISSKSPTSLNSQFLRQNNVYLHPSLGYKDNESVVISSVNGSVKLNVKNFKDLREDCVLIYSGTKGVNNLTTSNHALDAKCATFQENKVKISRG